MNRKFVSTVLFSGLILTFATGAYADRNWRQEHAFCGHHESMPQRPDMQKFVQHRLDRLASRLEIKASQQPAWEAYSQAVANIAPPKDAGNKETKPVENEDAATIMHRRADRVAEMAKKLAAIADATDKLQAVLTEDQRKILAQEVRHQLHGPHGGQFDRRWQGQGPEHKQRPPKEPKPNAPANK